MFGICQYSLYAYIKYVKNIFCMFEVCENGFYVSEKCENTHSILEVYGTLLHVKKHVTPLLLCIKYMKQNLDYRRI